MNPYLVLGLEENVSDEHEIRRAYKKLALKYHPDKPHGDEQKFNELAAAYDAILSFEKSSLMPVHDVGTRRGNLSEIDPFHLFNQFFRNLDDEMKPAEMKPAKMKPAKMKPAKMKPAKMKPAKMAENLHFDLTVTPAELLAGRTKLVGVRRQRFCQLCQGLGICSPSIPEEQGSIDISCFHCHGSGNLIVIQNSWPPPPQPPPPPVGVGGVGGVGGESGGEAGGGGGQTKKIIHCPLCHGEGIVIPITMDKCPSCLGNRLVMETALISVDLRNQQNTGDGIFLIRCVGEGNDSRFVGGNRGDLVLQVKCEFPRPWYRFQQHLIYFHETPVTLEECVSFPENGYQFSMIPLSPPDVDDQKTSSSISVCIKEVIRPVILYPGHTGSMIAVYVLDNYGLPALHTPPLADENTHGKLFILLEIRFPLTRSNVLSNITHVFDDNIDVICARPANEKEIAEIAEIALTLVLKK